MPEVHMPATTWNRQVSLDSDGKLQVSTPAGGNPPGHDDPPDSITLDSDSLPATIRYTAIGGVMLQGVNWDGDHQGVTANMQGATLIVQETDARVPGSNISYFVIDNANHTTDDPQIHNQLT
jgi:hypothetical protein